MGWSASSSRPQTLTRARSRAASRATGAPAMAAVPPDVAWSGGCSVAALSAGISGCVRLHCVFARCGVPSHSLLGPAEPHSRHRGGRPRRRTVAGDPVPDDPARGASQSSVPPLGRDLGRSLPRARALHSDRGEKCDRQRAHELPEARRASRSSSRRARSRSVFVGCVPRRASRHVGPRRRGGGAAPNVQAAHLACTDRVEHLTERRPAGRGAAGRRLMASSRAVRALPRRSRGMPHRFGRTRRVRRSRRGWSRRSAVLAATGKIASEPVVVNVASSAGGG